MVTAQLERRPLEMQRLTQAAGSLAASLLLLSAGAWAQVPVITSPVPSTTAGANASGTITTTGTWQKVFPARSTASGAVGRRGCVLQNNGTHTMYVTEGIGIAGSSTSNSAQVVAGGTYYCASGGSVLQGEVDVYGTIGDAFYAAED